MKTRLRLLCLLSLAIGASAVGGGSSGGADWRFFAAGGVSAGFSHGITTPMDVIKTKMQVEFHTYLPHQNIVYLTFLCAQLNPQKYGKNVGQATRMLIKEEGIGFMAQGLAPTVVGYGIEGTFQTYHSHNFL